MFVRCLTFRLKGVALLATSLSRSASEGFMPLAAAEQQARSYRHKTLSALSFRHSSLGGEASFNRMPHFCISRIPLLSTQAC